MVKIEDNKDMGITRMVYFTRSEKYPTIYPVEAPTPLPSQRVSVVGHRHAPDM